ncbi:MULTISPECIES: FxDxF family PEP-CTERM protein [unclassified Janthinobacterium]|uniref:FxDxF family PEP-CTERM protein n=1 Tax=unclassified Janthinobacterium TaxID=2610881 RepID=UPI00036FA83C|nr:MULTISPECIES: FxDxF family PEP-CTERM protein [unclassified Janthinobacterium]MEC5163365.1 hypothetical protein [Janthinobacterium sp. CG_S6]
MKKPAIFSALLFAGSVLFTPLGHAALDISSPARSIVLAANGSVDFGDKFKKNQKDAVFADRFDFTTTVFSDIDMVVTSVSTSASNGMSLTGFGLYNAQGALVQNGHQLLSGIQDKWTLSSDMLAAGAYYFQVSGTLLSAGGAAFGANGYISAVPEPQTYAMLLAGLAGLGLRARRRGDVEGVPAAASLS